MLVEIKKNITSGFEVIKHPGLIIEAMLTTTDELNSGFKDEIVPSPAEIKDYQFARRLGVSLFNVLFAVDDFIEGLTPRGRRMRAYRQHPFTEIGPGGIRKRGTR